MLSYHSITEIVKHAITKIILGRCIYWKLQLSKLNIQQKIIFAMSLTSPLVQ